MARKCDQCNGTGRCNHCKGSGKKIIQDMENPAMIPGIWCNGSGVCQWCRGRGER
ncbi:hypothetical protein [Atribacter sp.]|uniref:hypothetical protein n=1 Tax=Atribacter sp. TaxID=2847780 RepID=UPI00345ECE82